MTKNILADICFQCGKPRLKTKEYKEYFNGSLVTTIENVCSDPACQKRTIDTLSKEMARRKESLASKQRFVKKPIKSKGTQIKRVHPLRLGNFIH